MFILKWGFGCIDRYVRGENFSVDCHAIETTSGHMINTHFWIYSNIQKFSIGHEILITTKWIEACWFLAASFQTLGCTRTDRRTLYLLKQKLCKFKKSSKAWTLISIFVNKFSNFSRKAMQFLHLILLLKIYLLNGCQNARMEEVS